MTNDQFLHAALIGQPGSRALLNTPALVLDAAALQRNIATMAGLTAQAGVALRPHAKMHKSAEVARLQIAAGAVGLCCAKLGEAEALAAAGGVDSILITSPVVTLPAIERLARLHTAMPDLAVVVDHPDNARALAGAVADSQKPLPVLIDVDPGIHRTGVTSAEAAVALAQTIADCPSLTLRGVQFYCGMQQHTAGFAERSAQIAERMAYLRTVLTALAEAGHPASVVTGGGTGTHAIDFEMGVLTELQAGSYAMMDRQYRDCAL
jgi:3-hydroxy-D-aspartate aldolase